MLRFPTFGVFSWKEWYAKVDALSTKKKIIALLLAGLLLYGGLIVLDNLVIRPWIYGQAGDPVDLDYYRNRTQAILDGQIPYKDFKSESPPLIMYLMVPPQIFGGEMWMYQVYFASYAVITGLVLYLGLRKFSESKAFTVGLLYMMLPYCFIEFTFGVQDDSISFLFFFIPLLLLGLARFGQSSFMTVVGFWTKMFNVLLFPWSYLSIKERKDRLRFLGIAVLLALMIALPFLILSPEKFIEFPSYYLLGNEEAQTGGSGISPWHFLDRGGLTLPGVVGISMALGAILVSTYLAYRWRLSFWQGCALVLAAFVVFYPKIAFIYFVMPVTVLLLWGVDDRRVLTRIFAMSIPLFLAVPFSENRVTPVWDYSWGWMAGMVLALIGWIIFLDAFRLTMDKRPFPDAETVEKKDAA